MGMFDQLVPFNEHMQEGDYFTLLEAKVGNEIETEYGEGTPVLLKVKDVEIDGVKKDRWLSAFGQALVNQVQRMEPSDLPSYVAMVRKPNKSGKFEYKVLATQEQIENDDIPF